MMIRNLIAAYMVLLSVSLFAIAAILATRLIVGGLAERVSELMQYGTLFTFASSCTALLFVLHLIED
jgi:hypothetical protein